MAQRTPGTTRPPANTCLDWPAILLRACRLIEQADAGLQPAKLTPLLSSLGVSVSELQRQFRKHLGTTPKAYATALRLTRLASDIATADSALQASLGAGFGSSSRAYAVTSLAMGSSPGQLRRQRHIGYWLGLSRLGWMLMGTTQRGICWLAFGDDPRRMLGELRRAFPQASCHPDQERLRDWFECVREHILLPEAALRLPVDVQGTAFQARVWRTLRRIPLGATCSYAEVAHAIGQPRASRAVAAACAANDVALLIPCHRVVARDGRLSGYRWGVARKRTLLRIEGRPRQAQIATSTAGSRKL